MPAVTQEMGRPQFPDPLEYGVRGSDETMAQVLDKSGWTNGKVQGQPAQGLKLGGKGQQASAPLAKEKRLYAHTVPGSKKYLLLPVPDRKGKHAVQVFKTARTIYDESGQQDLRISLCSETDSMFFQV